MYKFDGDESKCMKQQKLLFFHKNISVFANINISNFHKLLNNSVNFKHSAPDLIAKILNKQWSLMMPALTT